MSQRETMQRAIDLLEAVRNGSIKPKFENRIPANSRSIKKEQPHDVSTFGTLLRAAVEKEIDSPLSCGQCVGYLRELNQQAEHDAAEISRYLYANFQWPSSWREKIGDKHKQKKRITEIVESIVTAEPPADK